MKPIKIRVTESTVAGGRRVEEKQILSAPVDIPVHDAHALISLGKAIEVIEMPEDPTDAPSAGLNEENPHPQPPLPEGEGEIESGK